MQNPRFNDTATLLQDSPDPT